MARYIPNLVFTFADDSEHIWLTIDNNNGVAVCLEDYSNEDAPAKIYRPLTQREKQVVIGDTVAYGHSPLWYRLWRALILSLTKKIYPLQGAPKMPRSNCGSVTLPEGSARK